MKTDAVIQVTGLRKVYDTQVAVGLVLLWDRKELR